MSIPLIGGQPRQVMFKTPTLKLLEPGDEQDIRPLGYVTDLDPRIQGLLTQMIDAAFREHPDVFDVVTAPIVDLMGAQTRAQFQFAIVLTDPLTPEERKVRDERARKLLA